MATALLGIAWYQIERRVYQPLVNLALFRLRAYNGALGANLMMNLSFAGLSFLLVLWLQNVRGYTAIQARILMLPATVGIFVCIPIGGRLEARRGGRLPAVAGRAVTSIGLFLLGFLAAGITMSLLAIVLLVVGLGLGLVSSPVAGTAVGDVPIALAGAAAGVFKMSSMLGGALGVAILTAFARGLTYHQAADVVRRSELSPVDIAQARQALINSSSFRQALASLPPDLRRKVAQAVTEAFSSGVADTMVATAVLTLAGTVAVFFLWSLRSPAASPTTADPNPTDDQHRC